MLKTSPDEAWVDSGGSTFDSEIVTETRAPVSRSIPFKIVARPTAIWSSAIITGEMPDLEDMSFLLDLEAIDQSTLSVGIAVDVLLGCLDRPVSGEHLNVPKARAHVMGVASGERYKCASAAVGRTASDPG
jgi:hypothetical protein